MTVAALNAFLRPNRIVGRWRKSFHKLLRENEILQKSFSALQEPTAGDQRVLVGLLAAYALDTGAKFQSKSWARNIQRRIKTLISHVVATRKALIRLGLEVNFELEPLFLFNVDLMAAKMSLQQLEKVVQRLTSNRVLSTPSFIVCILCSYVKQTNERPHYEQLAQVLNAAARIGNRTPSEVPELDAKSVEKRYSGLRSSLQVFDDFVATLFQIQPHAPLKDTKNPNVPRGRRNLKAPQ